MVNSDQLFEFVKESSKGGNAALQDEALASALSCVVRLVECERHFVLTGHAQGFQTQTPVPIAPPRIVN